MLCLFSCSFVGFVLIKCVFLFRLFSFHGYYILTHYSTIMAKMSFVYGWSWFCHKGVKNPLKMNIIHCQLPSKHCNTTWCDFHLIKIWWYFARISVKMLIFASKKDPNQQLNFEYWKNVFLSLGICFMIPSFQMIGANEQ